MAGALFRRSAFFFLAAGSGGRRPSLRRAVAREAAIGIWADRIRPRSRVILQSRIKGGWREDNCTNLAWLVSVVDSLTQLFVRKRQLGRNDEVLRRCVARCDVPACVAMRPLAMRDGMLWDWVGEREDRRVVWGGGACIQRRAAVPVLLLRVVSARSALMQLIVHSGVAFGTIRLTCCCYTRRCISC